MEVPGLSSLRQDPSLVFEKKRKEVNDAKKDRSVYEEKCDRLVHSMTSGVRVDCGWFMTNRKCQ
jgi:hypothetical protein